MFPQLKDHVLWINWDSHAKTLLMGIRETRKFEVVKWMSFVDNMHHEIQKSPFIDIDSNHAVLSFLDEDEREVASMKLKNLKVEGHSACLTKGSQSAFGIDNPGNALVHQIRLSYQYTELVVTADVPPVTDGYVDEAELKDGEWQTVEMPA